MPGHTLETKRHFYQGGATTGDSTGRKRELILEDDSMDTSRVMVQQQDAGQHNTGRARDRAGARPPDMTASSTDHANNMVFFKPLDNIAHLTLMGDAPRKCDFMGQTFSILSASAQHVSVGRPFGQPKLANLSHIPYDVLSSKLKIWDFEESGFHITEKMWLDHHKLFQVYSFFLHDSILDCFSCIENCVLIV